MAGKRADAGGSADDTLAPGKSASDKDRADKTAANKSATDERGSGKGRSSKGASGHRARSLARRLALQALYQFRSTRIPGRKYTNNSPPIRRRSGSIWTIFEH